MFERVQFKAKNNFWRPKSLWTPSLDILSPWWVVVNSEWVAPWFSFLPSFSILSFRFPSTSPLVFFVFLLFPTLFLFSFNDLKSLNELKAIPQQWKCSGSQLPSLESLTAASNAASVFAVYAVCTLFHLCLQKYLSWGASERPLENRPTIILVKLKKQQNNNNRTTDFGNYLRNKQREFCFT